MTVAPHQCWTQSEQSVVREELDRILASAPFAQSKRRQRFLEFIVGETVAGRGDRLKGYTIALEVFERSSGFDSNIDPIVRIEAGKLRDKLREYYETEGHGDLIRIDLPKGTYTPHIEIRPQAVTDTTLNAHTAPERVPAANGSDALPDHSGEAVSAAWPSGSASMGWKPLGLLAGAAIVIALTIGWQIGNTDVQRTSLDKPSIAVLPFDNIGEDAKWERFADGLTEDIITDLAHSKDLIVIARNSTEAFKDKPVDIRAVGRDLNANYVLEGSIQSIGERIRVTTQLVDAKSGGHVWAERYDRPADDLFRVQNEVTEQIAATLIGYQGAVAEAERSLLKRKPPASLTAYETYLLGIEAKHRVTKESLIEAERLLRQALQLDPKLARAYVGLVDVQCYVIDLGLTSSVEEAVAKMMEAGQMAVKLDPDDGKTHLALAFAYSYQGKPQQAAAEYDKAEALAPSDADVLLLIAWGLPGLGQSARAVSLAERALMLNPHYPDWYNQGLSVVFFFGGQYERAANYRSLVKEPLAIDYAYIAISNAYLSRTDDAEKAAANVMRIDPAWTAERYLSEGGGYAEMEAERFVDGARKAGLPACIRAETLKNVPSLIHVKSCDQQRATIDQ
jgi:TolB-like protein